MEAPGIGFEHIFDVYYLNPDSDEEEWNCVGRYMVTPDQHLHILSDYQGYLGGLPEGLMNSRTRAQLESFKNNHYFRVVSLEDVRQGHHPDLIPTQEFPSVDANGADQMATRPAPVFEYSHPLIGQPLDLEVRAGEMYLNGNKLTRAEAHRIMGNIRSKAAQIRYKRAVGPAQVQKAERNLRSLEKIEPQLAAALADMRSGVKKGAIHPDTVKHLMRQIFVDRMVPGVGNNTAYQDFLSRPKAGVHVRLDGNDFGQINKIHSFEHGDAAIKSMGAAMRAAADETVGRGNSKLFRIGGDEFHLHVPTHEHAAAFMRNLRSRLDAVPPIGGTHSLSVSAGFGRSPEEADQASIHAKQAKKAMNYPMGQAKTHVHSLLPDAPGPVPVDKEPALKAPPPETRLEAAPVGPGPGVAPTP